MTICFVSDSYPTLPTFGGIAVHTQRVARALAARGHEVHVIAVLVKENADSEYEGVHLHLRRVRWLPLIGKWLPGLGESLGIARIVAGLHRRHRFDVVEIPNWEGMAFASTWLPAPPIVIRLHTSLAESIGTAGRQPTRAERFTIWMERTSTRRAHAAVTHSVAHRARMADYRGRDDIEVIPHGVTVPEQVSPPEGKLVLAIGRMNARKGMETLIEAIPTVLARVPDAEIRVVGTNEEHPEVRKFRSQHPGLHQIQFLGFVGDERLRGLYDECGLYVSPAIYESFGLTFAEAMAHGRPVVGCAASAVPEIVRDGVDGILVAPSSPEPLANAIVTLLLDEDLRRRMGASGRQRAIENFSVETATARCERYFREVLENA